MEYLILSLSWLLYLFSHSALAASSLKTKGEKWIGTQGYRLLYVFVSLVGLVPILFMMSTIKPLFLLRSVAATQYIGMILASWGVIIISVSFRHISGLAFMGLKKELKKDLVTSGIHAKIRHPIYSGTLLIFLGLVLYNPTLTSLITLLCVAVYLPFGIKKEENKLIAEFGDDYLNYIKDVPALIPRIF